MKRTTFDETRDQRATDAPQRSTNCPAFGCPNAASTSFDHGGHWACFQHANAPPETWPAVTTQIRHEWPKSANWNHPEKVKYEAEQAAIRRSKLPPRRGPIGMAEILGDVR